MSYINNVKRNVALSPAYLQESREKFIPIQYLTPRLYPNACRYKNLRRIRDENTKKLYHETWIQKLIDTSSDDSYHTVTTEDANRLDMIAVQYYGTARYWWVIALANYLIDPFDVPVGSYLRIPPLISLYNEGGVLSG